MLRLVGGLARLVPCGDVMAGRDEGGWGLGGVLYVSSAPFRGIIWGHTTHVIIGCFGVVLRVFMLLRSFLIAGAAIW